MSNTDFQIIDSSHPSLIERAREYAAMGWAVTPANYQSKNPFLPGWQHGDSAKEHFDQYFASGEANIAIVLGGPSNGLVDVDLDDPAATFFADRCVSLPRFGKELTRRGFENFRKGNGNWRKGITLRAETLEIGEITEKSLMPC